MNDRGGISIVIPVLNEEENIEQLLAEFDKLISDLGLKEFNEVVFVDDGSKDQTTRIINEHKSSDHPYKIELDSQTITFTLSAALGHKSSLIVFFNYEIGLLSQEFLWAIHLCT